MTEQEQIAILKTWIKQYSLVILAGMLIAVTVISSWRYWQQRQQNTLSHASAIYDEMLASRAQNDKAALVHAKKLLEHYPETTYGEMAALMMAREAIIKKNDAEAETELNSVLNHSNIHFLRQIARLRLARLHIAEQKPNDALNELKTVEDKSFMGLIDEVRGDAFLALKDTTHARESYKQALAELPNAEVIRPILRMKYDNLAVYPTAS